MSGGRKRMRPADATNETCRRMIAEAEALGFEAYLCRSNHLKYVHPELGAVAFGALTPRSPRAARNHGALLRRLVAQAGGRGE